MGDDWLSSILSPPTTPTTPTSPPLFFGGISGPPTPMTQLEKQICAVGIATIAIFSICFIAVILTDDSGDDYEPREPTTGTVTMYVYNHDNSGHYYRFKANGGVLCSEYVAVDDWEWCYAWGDPGNYHLELDIDRDGSIEWERTIQLHAGDDFEYEYHIY